MYECEFASNIFTKIIYLISIAHEIYYRRVWENSYIIDNFIVFE